MVIDWKQIDGWSFDWCMFECGMSQQVPVHEWIDRDIIKIIAWSGVIPSRPYQWGSQYTASSILILFISTFLSSPQTPLFLLLSALQSQWPPRCTIPNVLPRYCMNIPNWSTACSCTHQCTQHSHPLLSNISSRKSAKNRNSMFALLSKISMLNNFTIF